MPRVVGVIDSDGTEVILVLDSIGISFVGNDAPTITRSLLIYISLLITNSF